jgi:hypothetical protein
VPNVELRGTRICESDRGEPDTEKSRRPQAAVNIRPTYLFTHVLILLHLRFVVKEVKDKKNSNLG